MIDSRPISAFKFTQDEYDLYQSGVEIWRDIEGYEGMYSISTNGIVKSHARIKLRGWVKYFDNERTLKYSKHKLGYLSVILCSSIQKKLLVHRLVAMTFLKNPENKPEVNHNDSTPSNPCLYNLCWMTSSENQIYAYRFGFQVPPYNYLGMLGAKHHASKKINQLDKNRNFIASFYGSKEASRELGIQATNIRKCARGERPYAGGFIWEYATD